MEYVVRSPMNRPDVVEVRYDCECGCKPRARYQRGTDEAGHEQCCCGRVHFVGVDAEKQLEAYIQERRSQGEDTDLRYNLSSEEVEAPWGERVPVAFGIPENPRKH